MNTVAIVAFLGLALSTGPDPVDGHLIAGASAFRDGRFDQALVEFRVAQKLGAADAAAYAAAALVKLGRPEDALDAFGLESRPGDPLLAYYRAMACYDAKLYHCADRLLAGVAPQGGPGMSEQAARIRAAIASILRAEPSTETIDWYLARCTGTGSTRPHLAAAYCTEAADLAARRSDAYGKARAQEGLSQAQGKGAGR